MNSVPSPGYVLRCSHQRNQPKEKVTTHILTLSENDVDNVLDALSIASQLAMDESDRDEFRNTYGVIDDLITDDEEELREID